MCDILYFLSSDYLIFYYFYLLSDFILNLLKRVGIAFYILYFEISLSSKNAHRFFPFHHSISTNHIEADPCCNPINLVHNSYHDYQVENNVVHS